jgi:hypothetical protein
VCVCALGADGRVRRVPGASRDDEGLHQSTPDRGRKGLVTLVFFFPAADIDETGSQSRSIVTSQPESERERACCGKYRHM